MNAAGAIYRLGRVPVDPATPRRCEAPLPKKHCDPHDDVACYRAETIDPATGAVRRKFFCLRAAVAWAYARGVTFPPGRWPEDPPAPPATGAA
jgi:hypothetical protein